MADVPPGVNPATWAAQMAIAAQVARDLEESRARSRRLRAPREPATASPAAPVASAARSEPEPVPALVPPAPVPDALPDVTVLPVARREPAGEPPASRAHHREHVLVDATGLPDGYPGPIAWDASRADPPAWWRNRKRAVQWSGGLWTELLAPAHDDEPPEGTLRIPAVSPRKIRGRWATLMGRRISGDHEAGWVLALDSAGEPLGVWATTPARFARLAAQVAGDDFRIPDRREWTVQANAASTHADEPDEPGLEPEPSDVEQEW